MRMILGLTYLSKNVRFLSKMAKENITTISLDDLSDEENEDIKVELNDDNLFQTILDLSIDINLRIRAFERYHELYGDDTVDLMSQLTGMYQFSGTKSIEYFLYRMCTAGKISVFLKFEAAKSLLSFEEDEEDIDSDDDEDFIEIKNEGNERIRERNDKRRNAGYKALDSTCSDLEDLATPCKIEAVCMLMEDSDHKDQSIRYFCNIINDQNIDCDYRYKSILDLESRTNEDGKVFQKWNIPDRNFLLTKAYLYFLFEVQNQTLYRILASQYLLQRLESCLDIATITEIQLVLLSFAQDDEIEYNLRADAADTLLHLAHGEIKDKAREIIMILGRVLGKVRTVFDNAQNVHVDEIEQSVVEALEFLSVLPFLEVGKSPITFEYVKKQITDMLDDIRDKAIQKSCGEATCNHEKCAYCTICNIGVNKDDRMEVEEEWLCSDECYAVSDKAQKIIVALNRINMDRVLYSKYNQTLINILMKVWTYLSGHESEEAMRQRMLEELCDMSGTCSSGFASRLINVISGFGQFNMRISWEDQIVANFSGRLNALVRKIDDNDSIYYGDKHRDVIELYLRAHKIIEKKENTTELEKIDDKDDKDDKDNKENTELETRDNKDIVDEIIDGYLAIDPEQKIVQAVDEFKEAVINEMMILSSVYAERPNFIKFFRDVAPSIMNELREEFKDLIDYTSIDLYLRKALMNYETGSTD